MKQTSRRKAQQTLRVTPAPSDIGAWLAAVNGIPDDQITPDGGGIPPLLSAPDAEIVSLWMARTNRAEALRQHKIQELRHRTRGWGVPTAAYIFREDTDPQEPGERLSELVSAWMTFWYIAEFASLRRHAYGSALIGCPLGGGARLISADGTLKVEISPFLKMLEGIETWRIRRCPICKQFFWAGRQDKSACREECSRVLRQRNLRARQKQNRAYKKGLAMRRKLKPTLGS
jgi:hypothetical protein